MRILGIDYGRKKIGLARADGVLAEPLVVLKFRTREEVIKKVVEIIEREKIEQVVTGISEGQMAEETRVFGKNLQEKSAVPVAFQDETLSSQDAQTRAIEGGINRKKRRAMEDAFAAAIMLQNYLDDNR